MDAPILSTKLFIPIPRQDLVPRPRLLEKLNTGHDKKLTLISAPAGFGKSTLLSNWVHQSEEDIVWVSLDESDNDPARFLTYFIAAINQSDATETAIGKGSLSLLQSSQSLPVVDVMTSLINEIALLPGKITLVLDDYHLIREPLIDESLTFLIEHQPQNFHLIIATRDDPHLPLARLRAKGQLTELRAVDLRFSLSETGDFLNKVMGLALSSDDIDALESRTEGWIAGLQLAAISLQGLDDPGDHIKLFTGSHRFVLDYLIEEVLSQQSEIIQIFLLKTAILDRMTGSLCDSLTGQDNGQATLEMLEHTNLFIVPLDEERRWYRYHHLFADLLRQRLHQTQSEQLPILHQKASDWYQQKGFVFKMIDHALRGENYQRAAFLIEDQFKGNYERINQNVLRQWLAEMPEEFVLSKPDLSILRAWNLFNLGQFEAANQSLQAAEKMLDPNIDFQLTFLQDREQPPDDYRMRLLGRLTAIRSLLASFSGNVTGTIEYARQALEYLPEQELEWRSAVLIAMGDVYASQGKMSAAQNARSDALATAKASGDINILMITNLSLAETFRLQGKLRKVIGICERQLKSANKHGISDSAVMGWLYGMWGETLAELNDLESALEKAKKGIELSTNGRDVTYISFSNLSLVRVLISTGDITGAEGAIQSIENSAHEYDLPHWASLQLSAWQARIWLAQGKPKLLSQWVNERELEPDREPEYLHELEYIVLARILITQGKPDEAVTLLKHLLEAAEAGGRTSRVIEIFILHALALQAQGDTEHAITKLEKALTLAKPGGFIRTFVDEGPLMEKLLKIIKTEDKILKKYIRKLLAVFGETKSHLSSTKQQPLIEPLRERELEVLHLIAEGLTNRQIASRLFLSINTIKVYTRNINSKLGVNSRTQAVAKARSLEILT